MRKEIVLCDTKKEIDPSCRNCKHFVFNWYSKPNCAIGRSIYGYCFDNEKRVIDREYFLDGLFRVKVRDNDPYIL